MQVSTLDPSAAAPAATTRTVERFWCGGAAPATSASTSWTTTSAPESCRQALVGFCGPIVISLGYSMEQNFVFGLENSNSAAVTQMPDGSLYLSTAAEDGPDQTKNTLADCNGKCCDIS